MPSLAVISPVKRGSALALAPVLHQRTAVGVEEGEVVVQEGLHSFCIYCCCYLRFERLWWKQVCSSEAKCWQAVQPSSRGLK